MVRRDLESLDGMQQGVACLRALLRRTGDDALQPGLRHRDAGEGRNVLCSVEVERSAQDFHLFLVGLLPSRSGCLASGGLERDRCNAQTHLPDTDEAT